MKVEVYFKEDSLMYKHLIAKGYHSLNKENVSVDHGNGMLRITDITEPSVHYYNLDTVAHFHLYADDE